MKPKTSADWQKVRDAYCNTAMPVQDICARFAIGASALYRRIKSENWPLRKEAGKPGRAADSGSNEGKDGGRDDQDDMIARLSAVFLNQLREAESAANTPGASAAERERAARALNVLLRNYEKLKEHEDMQVSKRDKTGADKSGKWQSGEEERLRKEIYERLTRILQDRRSGRDARKPRSGGAELSRP